MHGGKGIETNTDAKIPAFLLWGLSSLHTNCFMLTFSTKTRGTSPMGHENSLQKEKRETYDHHTFAYVDTADVTIR
jgi:hypothetical protein